MLVKRFEAIHEELGAKTANKDQAENLLAEVYYSLGCRVMLTANLWTENGFVNGSLGTIRDIVWEEGKDPSKDLPLAIMVEFDSYKGPFFEDTGPLFLCFWQQLYSDTITTTANAPNSLWW